MRTGNKLKILLVGHACSPRMGSEPSFTWNWAWHLSARHRVWLLAHPHDREGVEQFLATHPNPNLNITWVTPPAWLDPWNPSQNGHLIYPHYLLWQRSVLARARHLHAEIGFDLMHHVSWGSISVPPLLWKLPVPLVWGPVGGGQVAPSSFRRYFGSAWRGESVRSLRVRVAAQRPALRRAARHAALVLATNRETAQLLERAGGRVRLFLDSGVPSGFLSDTAPQRNAEGAVKVLWAGRLVPIKALRLALEAFAQVRELSVELCVAGDGPLRSESERLAAELGLNGRVRFLGRVPWEQMPRIYEQSHAFLFTSLRDSFGTQVLEAMASALPIITLDHQGVGTFVPVEAGIKVPLSTPEETVAGLAQAIRQLAMSPETRHRLGRVAWQFAQGQTWPHRAEVMTQLYEETLHANDRR